MHDQLNPALTGKQSYEAPALIRIGTFETITQANAGGSHFDVTFTAIAGAPANHNIFS